MLHASLIGARWLVSDLGHYSLMVGPVRRALVEPAASISDDAFRLLPAYYAWRLGAAGLNAGPSGNLSARCRDGVVSVGAKPAIAADRMEFGELSARTVLLATGGAPCV